MHHRGIDALDVADQSDISLDTVDHHGAPHRSQKPGVLAGQPDRVRAVDVDQVDQFAADLPEQHHAGDIEHLGCGDPEPTFELTGNPEAFEHGADLRPAAVHHHRVDPHLQQCHHVIGEGRLERLIGHRVAAVLDHDDLALKRVRAHELYAEFSST